MEFICDNLRKRASLLQNEQYQEKTSQGTKERFEALEKRLNCLMNLIKNNEDCNDKIKIVEAMKRAYDLSLTYEWLHCVARSLNGADKSCNLMCGTDAANTWMIVYEHIAKLASKWGSVKIECTPCWKDIEYTPYAPPEIEYKVKFNDKPVFWQHLDILRGDLPSKWILSVLTELYQHKEFLHPEMKRRDNNLYEWMFRNLYE